MLSIKLGMILSIALAFTVSLPVHSAVYKCKDEQGHISYSQMVCPEEAVVDKIMKLGSSRATSEQGVQCGLVKSFAAEVGIAVNDKQAVNDFYTRYGGMGELSPTVLAIIRSVYEYQSKPYKTIQNSVEFENERCLSEIYGAPDCSDFPVQFITSYGGCSQAADTNLRLKRLSDNPSDGKLRSDNKKANLRVANASREAQKRDRNQRVKECQEAARRSIERNQNEARSSRSANEQDRLRDKSRALKEQLARCSR